MQTPYVKVGSRTQAAVVPAAKSPAADGIAECDKALKRMSQGEKSRERQARWNAIAALPAANRSLDVMIAESAAKSEDESERLIRTLGRFASWGRTIAAREAITGKRWNGFKPDHYFAFTNQFRRALPLTLQKA